MRASRQRSWPLLLAIAGSMLVVGGVLLVLMRGAFRVGENMIASVEDTRPLGRKPRANEARVRAAEHVETPTEAAPRLSPDVDGTSIAANESTLPTVTISGRIVWPAGVPADEHVEVRLRTLGEYGAIVCGRIVEPGQPFRLEAQRGTRNARVEIVARYLYLERPPHLSLASSTQELVLEPQLGGYLHGRVITAPKDEEELGYVRSAEIGLLTRYVPSRAALSDEAATVKASPYASCKLDGELRFEFGGVIPHRPHELLVHSSWIAQPSNSVLTLRPGESRELELRSFRRVAVRGRVVDRDGQPVIGATCRLILHTPQAPLNDARMSSVSDVRGEFAFSVDDECAATLTATKAGCFSGRLELPPHSNRSDLELRLQPSTPITGRVTWPNGTPAHGVRVCADDEELDNAPSALSITDEDGEFELANLAGGPFTLTARVQRASDGLDDLGQPDGIAGAERRYATAVLTHVPRTNGTIEIVLGGDVAVRGRVLDERDQPWKRVRVAARPIIGDAEHGDAGREIASSFDELDGSFELRGLHPGEWEVTASFAALVSKPQRVTLGRTDAQIVLRFERGLCARGFVVDTGGALVPGAHVMLWEGGSLDNDRVRQARCDSKGTFQFDRVAPGPIELGASFGPDGESSVVKLDAEPSSVLERIELRLRPTGTIRGDVVDAAGAPIEGVLVEWGFDDAGEDPAADPSLERWRGIFSRRECDTRSHEDGTFASERLTAGQYLVRARREPRVSKTLVVEVRENKASRIHITLEDGIAVEARMPKVYGVRFHALDTRGNFAGTVKPVWGSRDSLARLLLPPGSYRIVARASGGREAWANVQLEPRASQPVAVEFAFRP